MTSPDTISGERFSDRYRGKGFVLSEYRAASRLPAGPAGAAKCKQIVTDCIHTTCNRSVKCELLCMCQNITHVYKQIVN